MIFLRISENQLNLLKIDKINTVQKINLNQYFFKNLFFKFNLKYFKDENTYLIRVITNLYKLFYQLL